MIRHNVLLNFSDKMQPGDRVALLNALEELPEATGVVESYQFGFDLGIDPGNAAMSIVATFRDVEAYETYRDHPAHLDLIARLIKPFVTSRSAAQVEHPL